MDKTTGFALLGFLLLVLASGWSASTTGGGGGGAAVTGGMGGGGGGGGGGDVCSAIAMRMRACQSEILAEVPAEYRDKAAAEFEAEVADGTGDCQRHIAKKPEDAAKVQGCLAAPDCRSFMQCL